MNKTSILIRQNIFDRLRREIMSCELKPGTKIYEQSLAERYQVSKSPVRDALQRLQEQQLIEVIPRKGYRIRPVSLSDALELYEMRLLLESASVKDAVKNASDEQTKQLDEFRQIPEINDITEWLEYNKGFHFAIANISGNSRMTRACQDVIEQFDRLTIISVNQMETNVSYHKFVHEHCDIIDAIQQREKTVANRLITAHINGARKRTLAVLDNMQVVT